jgi:hypothetical protein
MADNIAPIMRQCKSQNRVARVAGERAAAWPLGGDGSIKRAHRRPLWLVAGASLREMADRIQARAIRQADRAHTENASE